MTKVYNVRNRVKRGIISIFNSSIPPSIPPTWISPPNISGENRAGGILNCDNGIYEGDEPITLDKFWYKGEGYLGINDNQYTLLQSDAGFNQNIKVLATITNSEGSANIESNLISDIFSMNVEQANKSPELIFTNIEYI